MEANLDSDDKSCLCKSIGVGGEDLIFALEGGCIRLDGDVIGLFSLSDDLNEDVITCNYF